MNRRIAGMLAASLFPVLLAAAPSRATQDRAPVSVENGIVQVESAYGFDETVERIKRNVAEKGITFFAEIQQSKLAGESGIALAPSTLLIFGNPALGAQFMTSNPVSGIDWPVRVLVLQDRQSKVFAVYNSFDYIARRHAIADRGEAFAKATGVIESITGAVGR
jgi:uncharacterized protein (DUF302 family)